ncbi:hypothetical protein D3C87_574030 [compost metagenome]
MDRFVKFKLPIDKDKIDWDAHEMKHGGKQLLEILEKEYSIEMLTSYSIEASHLNLRESEINRLTSWLYCNCNIKECSRMTNITIAVAKSFFYNGAGLLAKMYRYIDLTPVMDENGEFQSRFTFIDYDISEMEYGYLTTSKINTDFWHKKTPSKYEKTSMKKYFFYDHEKNQIDPLSELGKDLYDSIDVMEEIVGS